MSIKKLFSASSGWLVNVASRTLRPAYLPSACAPEGAKLSADLLLSYQSAVVKGYQSMRQLMEAPSKKSAKKSLGTGDISANVHAVGVKFDKAAASLDPDGIASEMVRMFCVGVPHMDDLGNQRRVAMIWSALLAPAVVMREKHGHTITVEDVVAMAVRWVAEGTTKAAELASKSRDTRFISAHPARVYELLTDTAIAHKIDHMKLVSSVVDPMILPLGQYIGARQAAAGVQVDALNETLHEEGSK